MHAIETHVFDQRYTFFYSSFGAVCVRECVCVCMYVYVCVCVLIECLESGAVAVSLCVYVHMCAYCIFQSIHRIIPSLLQSVGDVLCCWAIDEDEWAGRELAMACDWRLL